MGVQPVPLDDLLVFSLSFGKLQGLLKQLIESSNIQEEALQLLRNDTTKAQEGFDKRIAEQDAALQLLRDGTTRAQKGFDKHIAEQEAAIRLLRDDATKAQVGFDKHIARQDEVLARAREQFAASSGRLDATVASVEVSKTEILEQAKRINERMGSVERRLDERVGAIEAQDRDASEMLRTAQSGLNALKVKLAGVEALTEQERLAAAEREKVLEKRVQEQVNGLSDKITRQFTSSLEELKQTVHSHDRLLVKLDGDVERHIAKLESVREQLAKLETLEKRFEAIEGNAHSLAKSVEVARKRLDDLEGREAQIKIELQEMASREAAQALSINKVQEGLHALRADSTRADSTLRGLIDALSKRFEDDVNPVKAVVNALTGKMNDFMDSGASATANCLCCGGKRATKYDNFVVGTDGKIYFGAPNGETVSLGRIPGFGLPSLGFSSHSGSTRQQVSPSASTGTLGRHQMAPTRPRPASALGTSASAGKLV